MTTKERFISLIAFFATFHMIIFAVKVVTQSQEIERLKNQPKTIIYKVDNAGGIIDRAGTVTAKNVLEGRYTVTISGYGNFLVNKEQYDSLKIGDPMPEYLKGVGS